MIELYGFESVFPVGEKGWYLNHQILGFQYFLDYLRPNLSSGLHIHIMILFPCVKGFDQFQSKLLLIGLHLTSIKERSFCEHVFLPLFWKCFHFSHLEENTKSLQTNKDRCGKGLKSNNHIIIQLFMALSAREKCQTCQARKYCTVAILAALTLQLSLQKQRNRR